MTSNAHNSEIARQQAEKECREQFDEEMKRVLQKHATDVSTIKKKQWVGFKF